MRILLDYDHTFDADVMLWEMFIQTAQGLGHDVYIVTMRPSEEPITTNSNCQIIYTESKAKIPYCRENLGLEFDIFIEDRPICLYVDRETIHGMNEPDESINNEGDHHI